MQDSNVLIQKLYPVIEKLLSKSDTKFKAHMHKYFTDRHEVLFDIAPYDRIYYNQTDIDDLFKSIGITEEEVASIMRECFFWDKPYNPQCAREPYVMTVMMAIRYYLLKKNMKAAEITTIYLAFSGKFYASLHAGVAFPKAPPSKNRAAMDYVINNVLTDKFDLKKEGTVFGAIKSLCVTWLNKYEDKLKSQKSSDDDFGKLVQQLRDRERSFLMNIQQPFMKAIETGNYLNYETDNLSDENFRLADNDASTAARITESTMNYITSNHVSLKICNDCKDSNVKALEIKDIMESIFSNNENLPEIRRVINIIIVDFMMNYPGKSLKSIEFISYTAKPKPNTKSELIIELKDTIISWLDENSPAYRKRKSRKATAMSYYRSVILYLAFVIAKCG